MNRPGFLRENISPRVPALNKRSYTPTYSSELRDRGVLILGSGNIVHNLGAVNWRPNSKPHDFALEFDALFTEKLAERDFTALADRAGLGHLLTAAHPTVDHYLPALTIAGASDARDDLTYMTDCIDLGSISMRSFVFHVI